MGSLSLPSAGPVYVDAQVVIYTVENHAVYDPLAQPLWSAVMVGSCEAVTSELSVMEALAGPLKARNAAHVMDFERFFQLPGFRQEPVTQAVLRRAAEIRATSRLRTPDAIHAATAFLLGCPMFLPTTGVSAASPACRCRSWTTC